MAETLQKTILLVEDEEDVRRIVRQFLGEAGHRVIDTGQPEDALDLTRRERPDLVICDIAMPSIDGYGVLRALQADAETAAIPVVFLSAHRDFSERMRSFRAGVLDYITKPFTRDTLQKRVERILDGRTRRANLQGGPEAGDEGASEGEAEAGREDAAAGLDPPAADPAVLVPGGGMPSFEDFPEVLRDVLIVDDNADFRVFLTQVFRTAGFTVHQAGDGEEGLEMALDRRPWLILTDIRMPGAGGLEFCRKVRSHSLIRQTPLLFLSGLDDYRQRYRALEMGADDFISKQTSVRELLIRIQLLMKKYADLRTRGPKGAGMEGELAMIGAPGVLQMCHLSLLTGVLAAHDGPRPARVRFRSGEIVGAECDGAEGLDALFAFVGWTQGRFRFEPRDPGAGAPLGRSFDGMLLEACRRLDETNRAAAEQQSTRGPGDTDP